MYYRGTFLGMSVWTKRWLSYLWFSSPATHICCELQHGNPYLSYFCNISRVLHCFLFLNTSYNLCPLQPFISNMIFAHPLSCHSLWLFKSSIHSFIHFYSTLSSKLALFNDVMVFFFQQWSLFMASFSSFNLVITLI